MRKIKFSLLNFGSEREIRTPTNRVKVCCATITQSRYIKQLFLNQPLALGTVYEVYWVTSFMTLTKLRCYWRWWAGWVSSPLFRWELDLQSNAFADSLPTHILNKHVEGGRHCQRQNINRTHIKERKGHSLGIWRRAEVSIPMPSLAPLVFKTRLTAGWVNPPFKSSLQVQSEI